MNIYSNMGPVWDSYISTNYMYLLQIKSKIRTLYVTSSASNLSFITRYLIKIRTSIPCQNRILMDQPMIKTNLPTEVCYSRLLKGQD